MTASIVGWAHTPFGKFDTETVESLVVRVATDAMALLIGFALPFSFIPVSIAALAGVEPHEAGLASGLINTAQQVGGAIGVAVASSVSISHFNHLIKTGTPFAQAFTAGSQWGFWVIVGVAVVGLFATIGLIRRDELPELEGETVVA